MGKLINLTNHPYSEWGEAQKKASKIYGDCIDIPFPIVDPEAEAEDIAALADEYLHKITGLGEGLTVHVMGEQTFCYSLITKLKKLGIPSIASATARDVTILPDGSKQVRFHFSRFREYK